MSRRSEASLRYENVAEIFHLDPLAFAYSYFRRTGKMSHEDLRRMDAAFVAAFSEAGPRSFVDRSTRAGDRRTSWPGPVASILLASGVLALVGVMLGPSLARRRTPRRGGYR